MTAEKLKALRTLQVTRKFAVYAFRSPVPDVDITLYQSTGDLFDPDRAQYLRVICHQRYERTKDDAVDQIIAWMGLNAIVFKPHRTRWGMFWFDIHLTQDQLFDFRMRWG